MTKAEFYQKIENSELNIGRWQIETENITDSEMVMGCVFDDGKWKVFKTRERLGHYIIDEFIVEEEAFDELYELVLIQAKDEKRRKRK